ncbi:hypothetical protein AWW66_11745 [Micromonospora rosaria]|uniref:SurA N-terminal domain-containing protein n=1 Tax=Micromonospora rosaria TaxID=47874 RepID=A0A136PTN2_9ACTN|nr:hypothetical protein [Micromonospora rosaria]KXK61763.1 hypothetical protein AWW66_11745 [Micromonospora rosaria]
MRVRRLIAAASVAAIGVLSVAGCGNASPDVAAYVGDTRYSVDRVDEVFDDAQTKYSAVIRQQGEETGVTPAPEQLRADLTRQDVIDLLVSIELGKRVAEAQNVQVANEITPDQLAAQLRMPPTAEYARLWSEWLNISGSLSAALPPAELSDASVMAVYKAIEKTGAIQAGLSVAEVRQAFGQGAFVRQASALSAALTEEAERAGTTINPRYRPVGVPSVVSTGQSLVFYSLPYIDRTGPVTDISSPRPAAEEHTPDDGHGH